MKIVKYQGMISTDSTLPQSTLMDGRSQPYHFDSATYLVERQAIVEAALDQSVVVKYPEKIYQAMRYSLMAGGKRLRRFSVQQPANLRVAP